MFCINIYVDFIPNCSCFQDLANLRFWDGDHDDPRHVIVNTEWGAFGDDGELDFLRTR